MAEDTTPRLRTSNVDPATAYAPISWMVIAACLVAVVFFVILAVLGWSAFNAKLPLVEPWLFGIAGLGIILAFASRVRIQNSEGTMSGIRYANYAWWICVVGGLGYMSYLFTIEWTIRGDAERAFNGWAEHLKAANPTDLEDLEFKKAAFLIFPPERQLLKEDLSDLSTRFGNTPLLQTFRHNELFSILRRNEGHCKFISKGMKDWRQNKGKIECELSVMLETPDGDYPMLVPMQAIVDSRNNRQWQIMRPDGFIGNHGLTSHMTKFGWYSRKVEISGLETATELLNTMSNQLKRQPEPDGIRFVPLSQIGLRLAYDVFVTKQLERSTAEKILETCYYRMAVTGPMGLFWPGGAGFTNDMNGPILSRLDGKPMTDEGKARLRGLLELEYEGRLRMAGPQAIQGFPERHLMLRYYPDRIELTVPLEVRLGDSAEPTAAARGRFIFEVTEKPVIDKLMALRDGPREFMNEAPPDAMKLNLPWKLIRIESDLKTIIYKQASQQGPPGG